MALPWFKFYCDAPEHPKVADLCVALGDDEADVYLYRLWALCSRAHQDGRFTGANPGGVLERGVRWRGEPGALAAALKSVGLLDETDGTLVVHDWATTQSAHAAKMERDRNRPPGRERPARVPRGTTEGHARDNGGTIDCPAPVPRGTSPISTLSSASKGGVGGDDAPAPQHVAKLDAVWREEKGTEYRWTRKDEETLRALLAFDADEVAKRFRIGLRMRYPKATCVAHLHPETGHWNAYAKEDKAPAKPGSGTLDSQHFEEGHVPGWGRPKAGGAT